MVAVLNGKRSAPVKVRKYDAANKRHYEASRADSFIDIPMGDELEAMVREQQYAGTKDGFHAMRRFLNEHNLRARDVVAAYLGVENVGKVLMSRLVADDNIKPLFGPLLVTSIAAGFQEIMDNWKELVNNIPIDGGSIQDFRFEDFTSSDAYTLKLVGQGGPIPVARITWSGRTIVLTYKGRGIEWSDKAKRAPLNLAEQWFMRVGKRLARDYMSDIGVIARDGYFDDLSDAPDVIQTEDATKFQPQDVPNGIDVLEEDKGFTATHVLLHSGNLIGLKVMQWPDGGGPVSPGMNVDGTYGVKFVRINSVGVQLDGDHGRFGGPQPLRGRPLLHRRQARPRYRHHSHLRQDGG